MWCLECSVELCVQVNPGVCFCSLFVVQSIGLPVGQPSEQPDNHPFRASTPSASQENMSSMHVSTEYTYLHLYGKKFCGTSTMIIHVPMQQSCVEAVMLIAAAFSLEHCCVRSLSPQ